MSVSARHAAWTESAEQARGVRSRPKQKRISRRRGTSWPLQMTTTERAVKPGFARRKSSAMLLGVRSIDCDGPSSSAGMRTPARALRHAARFGGDIQVHFSSLPAAA